MLIQLLPQRIDNTHRGHWLGLWLFAVVIIMKGGIGLGTIFNGRSAAIDADGIPLDSFGSAGADAFVSLFAAWGLSQVMLNLIGLLALIRYRALVPFMFALLLLEHLCRKLIFLVLPLARSESAPGFYINLGIVAVMVAGLILSLRSQDDLRSAA